MTFGTDIEIAEEIVRKRDPSFRTVDPARLERLLASARAEADKGRRDGVLLALMRLAAAAGNAHSRVIPNEAIRVLPLRIVAIGNRFVVTNGPDLDAIGELLAVNGQPVEELAARLAVFLPGPASRQRALSGLLLAWPASLAAAGVAHETEVSYTLRCRGTVREMSLPCAHTVSAPLVYPLPEQGYPSPGIDPWAGLEGPEGTTCIRLPSLDETSEPCLDGRIGAATEAILAAPDAPAILDLRGNAGGSFLRALPLIDALRTRWHGSTCTVLVDKFTFSAAIVVVALLRAHLGARLLVLGEPMGDGLRFWAEGGTEPLPETGAAFRWSDGYHDWRTGRASAETPPDIAAHMVGAGDITPLPLQRACLTPL